MLEFKNTGIEEKTKSFEGIRNIIVCGFDP